MTDWKVSNSIKKSVEEHEFWEKDGMVIRRITGWRFGSWIVTTKDDIEPQFIRTYVPFGTDDEDSIDMYDCCENNIENVELHDTWDSWCDNFIWPDSMEDSERERLETLWYEESYESWESEGWTQTETEMWVWGDLTIEKYEE
mgnify:CR=1 FL=1